MTFIDSAADLTGPFYAALAQGELYVQHCNDCAADIMYPKYRCPVCFGNDLGWVAAGGGGVLQTFTMLRAGAPSGFEVETPYAVGIVRLDEGPQVLGRLHPGADGTWDHYACDERVSFRSPGATEIEARPAVWFGAP